EAKAGRRSRPLAFLCTDARSLVGWSCTDFRCLLTTQATHLVTLCEPHVLSPRKRQWRQSCSVCDRRSRLLCFAAPFSHHLPPSALSSSLNSALTSADSSSTSPRPGPNCP